MSFAVTLVTSKTVVFSVLAYFSGGFVHTPTQLGKLSYNYRKFHYNQDQEYTDIIQEEKRVSTVQYCMQNMYVATHTNYSTRKGLSSRHKWQEGMQQSQHVMQTSKSELLLKIAQMFSEQSSTDVFVSGFMAIYCHAFGSAKGQGGIIDQQDEESIRVSDDDKRLKRLTIANSVNRPFVGLGLMMRHGKGSF